MALHLNKSNFEKEAEQSDVPVVIDFWAEWCGPCQMMGPVFEELSGDYEGKAKFAKVNTEEEPELSGQFNITGIPCIIVTQKGKEVGRVVGFAPKEAMKQRIDSILESV